MKTSLPLGRRSDVTGPESIHVELTEFEALCAPLDDY
jgi:hypothetical protein